MLVPNSGCGFARVEDVAIAVKRIFNGLEIPKSHEFLKKPFYYFFFKFHFFRLQNYFFINIFLSSYLLVNFFRSQGSSSKKHSCTVSSSW